MTDPNLVKHTKVQLLHSGTELYILKSFITPTSHQPGYIKWDSYHQLNALGAVARLPTSSTVSGPVQLSRTSE